MLVSQRPRRKILENVLFFFVLFWHEKLRSHIDTERNSEEKKRSGYRPSNETREVSRKRDGIMSLAWRGSRRAVFDSLGIFRLAALVRRLVAAKRLASLEVSTVGEINLCVTSFRCKEARCVKALLVV